MSLFSEVRNGSLTIPHPGNKNILSTIPLSLDPDNRGGIAPLEFPSGLDLFRTTPGTIKDASNLHRDQTPYPLNEIVFDQVEPRQQIADELLFDKPRRPAPPRQYELETNHALELSQQFYPDGTPMHSMPVDPTVARRNLLAAHNQAVRDIQKIIDPAVRAARMDEETMALLAADPQLYMALYQHIVEEPAQPAAPPAEQVSPSPPPPPAPPIAAAEPPSPPVVVREPADNAADNAADERISLPPSLPRSAPADASVHDVSAQLAAPRVDERSVIDLAGMEDEKSYEPPTYVSARITSTNGLRQDNFTREQLELPVLVDEDGREIVNVRDVQQMSLRELHDLLYDMDMSVDNRLERFQIQALIITDTTGIRFR